MRSLFLILGTLITVAHVNAAFAERILPRWCSNNLNSLERTICRTPELAVLDVTLGETFKVILRGLPEEQSDALDDQQAVWRKWRATCGTDLICLKHRYTTRIIELAGYLPPYLDNNILANQTISSRSFKYPFYRVTYQDQSYMELDRRDSTVGKYNADGTPKVTVQPFQIDQTTILREQLHNIENRLYSFAQPIIDTDQVGLYDGLLDGLDNEQRIELHLNILFGG